MIDKAFVLALDLALERWQSAEQFEREELVAWANLHGWNVNSPEGRTLILRQAALDIILQALIPELRAVHFQTPPDELGIELPQTLLDTMCATWRTNQTVFNFWGNFYNLLIPQAKRRRIGQFWTDENLANLMTTWLLEKEPRSLTDLGCGTGNFLLASQHTNPQLPCCGIDISPLLLNVTLAAHFTLRPHAPTPTLTAADFLESKHLESSDAVVCNPPYTRHHDIAPQQKDALQNLLKSYFHFDIPRQGTLAFYFLLKLIAELPTGAHAAVIVPMQVLDARYGKAAKRILASHTRLEAMIHFSPHLNAFHQVDVGGAILLFEKRSVRGNRFRHLTLDVIPRATDALEAIASPLEGAMSLGVVTTRAQDDLFDTPKWFSFNLKTTQEPVFQNGVVVPLKQLARIVRGIATGANDFFMLTDALVNELKLHDFVVRAIHRNREIQGLYLDENRWRKLGQEGKRVWLLYLNANMPTHAALEKYLAQGAAQGYPARSLIQTRRVWYEMEKREIPAIFFTILTRGNPRFILNIAQVRPLNMFSLLYPQPAIVRAGATELLWALLNSRFSLSRLHSVSRTYGGNTLKVEPRELDNLPVINPLALSTEHSASIRQSVNDFFRHDDANLFQREMDELVLSALAHPSTASSQSELAFQPQLLETRETYSDEKR